MGDHRAACAGVQHLAGAKTDDAGRILERRLGRETGGVGVVLDGDPAVLACGLARLGEVEAKTVEMGQQHRAASTRSRQLADLFGQGGIVIDARLGADRREPHLSAAGPGACQQAGAGV